MRYDIDTINRVDVTFLPDGRVRLKEPLSLSLPGGSVLRLEEGFKSDGGTIPFWVWSLLRIHPYKMPILIAFLAHDKVCDEAYTEKDYSKRVYADAVFYYVAVKHGASLFQTVACYLAVRWYGRAGIPSGLS